MPESKESKDTTDTLPFLPMTAAELQTRGLDSVDVVFVTGDSYVDHPSFAMAILGRVIEAAGFSVAILAQPDWHSAEPWKTFGRPNLAFCISAGNMDSMINHYTANRKVRNDDAYSPGGVIGLRPDRATLSYSQRAREAFSGVPILIGGVEASLRRLAHYDYWSDKVKRSILLDAKADLLVYGMGESPLIEILTALRQGQAVSSLRSIRGTAYRIGASEDLPEEDDTTCHLSSFEEVAEDKAAFAEMTRLAYLNLNPFTAKRLVQQHGLEAAIINPPAMPLTTAELDRIYSLPFTGQPHPHYRNKAFLSQLATRVASSRKVERAVITDDTTPTNNSQNSKTPVVSSAIPALKVVQHSVQIVRGCFGGCAFCSLTAHQGKIIQSRSPQSVVAEVNRLAAQSGFRGVISDLGGPTANMYGMGCSNPEMTAKCQRISCMTPSICPHLDKNHAKFVSLLREVRSQKNIKQVFIASGIRTDLAQESPQFVEELIEHHIGGHMKTAPEHVDPMVLQLMNKPSIENYQMFCELFSSLCEKHHKDHYLVPYLIAGLPGSDLKAMVKVAEYLKLHDIRPQQVQEFIPGPFELATCMYYTGINPLTGRKVYTAKGLRERRLQKALLLYYNPAMYHDVKTALLEADRADLIGDRPNCLVPSFPPKDAALRQTSRVKRLTRKTLQEQKEKDARREELIRQQQERERSERRGGGGRREAGDRARSVSKGTRDERRDFSGPPRQNSDQRGERREGGGRRDDTRGPRRDSDQRRDFSAPRRDSDQRGETREGGDRSRSVSKGPRDERRDFSGPRRDSDQRDGSRGERREGGDISRSVSKGTRDERRDSGGERREAGGRRDDTRGPRRDSDQRGERRDFSGREAGGRRDDTRGPRRDSDQRDGARGERREGGGQRRDFSGPPRQNSDQRGERRDGGGRRDDARGPRRDSDQRDGVRGERRDAGGRRDDARGPRRDSDQRRDFSGPPKRNPHNDNRRNRDV